MGARPGITIGFAAGSTPHVTIVKGTSIQLWDTPPGEGPTDDTTISLGADVRTLADLVAKIEAEAQAFTAVVHADAADYCLSAWLESVSDVEPVAHGDFMMTTAFIAKNPTVPIVGNVRSGTVYGDGDALTGTLDVQADNPPTTILGGSRHAPSGQATR